jgi:catecholate siderophore receptor
MTHDESPLPAAAPASDLVLPKFAYAAFSLAMAGIAHADATSTGPAPEDGTTSLPPIEVTGTVDVLPKDIPQSILTVPGHVVSEQAVTTLEDVLRNVPGITFNAGEGGSHGDSLNLRGISVPDSFFVDGIRDIGLYQRDTFDEQAAEVLLGPSSVLFGRGSTAGVINQVTKQASVAPFNDVALEVGSANFERATGDFDYAIDGDTAVRLNLMGQRNHVVDRDHVLYQKNGFAPTIAFGIDKPTSLTLSFLHQQDNDLPDYGIPFVGSSPAAVDRSTYYGLTNYDRTRSEADIATLRFETKINDQLTFENSLRYAHYNFQYLFSGPNLADDYTEVPPPGTPLDEILVYHDQASSEGSQKELVDHADLTGKFETGPVAHTLIAGVELSRETLNVERFANGIDDLPPTTLVNPVNSYSPPTPLDVVDAPQSVGTDLSADVMDTMHVLPVLDVDAGVRWDRFSTHFSEVYSGSAYQSVDTEVSPRAAVVYKPAANQSYYASYGESYNPAIEYLTLAPDSQALAPEKDYTLEAGAKIGLLKSRLSLTGAVFDTLLKDARNADPDDPTVQDGTFDQRVEGVEVGVTGYLTSQWEVTAGYTHLRDRITGSDTDPGAIGKLAPNVAQDSANAWLTFEPTSAWQLGVGALYQGKRFADQDNTAWVPSYGELNGMVSYRVNRHLELQLNMNNITDKLFFYGIYYTGPDENHAIPAPGRTFLFTARLHF